MNKPLSDCDINVCVIKQIPGVCKQSLAIKIVRTCLFVCMYGLLQLHRFLHLNDCIF